MWGSILQPGQQRVIGGLLLLREKDGLVLQRDGSCLLYTSDVYKRQLQRHLIARHGGDLLFAEDAPGLALDHTLFGLDVVKSANSFYDISLHPFLPQDSSALHQSPRPVPSPVSYTHLL